MLFRSFFTTKFSGVLNAVAQDFQAAMSDPIGFVTGKLDSALAVVMNNGGNTFQTSFEKAGGSALDKISAGLGAVSDEYGAKIVDGSIRAKDEFGKLVSTLEKSDKDFFGAKESTTVAAEKLAEVTESGKKLRENFEKSSAAADDTKTKTKGAAGDAEDVAKSFDKAANSAGKIKQELSVSAKLMKSIEEARAKDAVDRGGRDTKRAQDAIARGDFRGAERAAGRIAAREADNALRGSGKNRDNRNLSDIGRDYGLNRKLGESDSSFRERIKNARENGDYGTNAKGKPAVDKPGQSGKTPEESKGSKSGGKATLDTLVADIKKLLEKIEPKLPVAALV